MTGSLELFKKTLASRSTPLALGIAGGSGSGKTTLARLIHQALGTDLSAILAQDSYYIDQSARFDGDGGSVNFDHPSSLDFDLLATHLMALLAGNDVKVPIYDFATHSRRKETEHFPAKKLIIVDGTLILDSAVVRGCFSMSVFVDTSEAQRFDRRLNRDVRERGRTPEGVQKQFERQVKPMHDAFVQPSMTHASLVVSGEGSVENSIEVVWGGLSRL